jgi:hypothetical protein
VDRVSTRRDFLKTAGLTAATLAAPLALARPAPALACQDTGLTLACGGIVDRPEGGEPGFTPSWVRAYLPTMLWPTATELDTPLGKVEFGQYFRVQAPQSGPRLYVFDPRSNQMAFVGAEAVGPVGPPEWAKYLDGLDGRWIDVTLTPLQHYVAMQGDLPLRQGLVTAGTQGTTKPGYYQINRRVYNETMDSRTIPGLQDHYLLKNVLFTQYFTYDGAALHYNWWGPPRGFGYPGSHGCLGMQYDDSKYLWDWADIGTPVVIHM